MAATKKNRALLLTDAAAAPVSAVSSAVRDVGVELAAAVADDDLLVITQAFSLGGKLPVESVSMDVIISVSITLELLQDQLLEEIGRVLKPGGKILVQTYVAPTEGSDKQKSALERKLLMAGFLEVQSLETKPFLPLDGTKSVTIEGKKASWTLGSSFSIKKVTKTIPKIQINDESDLIDEDSLLTEEDLKKPQLPTVGDCEVGSTRKACKNCTCGRAEEEERAVKLGLTAEQMNNPQSACGSCGLGDAFRCASCPYKGLPPFKLGEKVSLSGNFLAADI
ncbi:anamorsin-like protein isoform X2 [Iris pallida]|uniref:Anamorsin homolog n=1 Tax=Iris pallida TaxID=29817 RepID=A0AAX6GUN6_IRIPA|nr:anamorsin-like protein isoform X2 [Iris pallida]KAJ6832234.1 anamorsin-like protein isoform X2 [Iris pallida]